MEDRLMECPICGEEPEDHNYYVACNNKKCKLSTILFERDEWNTRATDPLLEKMAKALEELDDMFDPTSGVGEIINKALQEYREWKDATI